MMKLYEPGSYEVVPHDNIRKIIARRLVEAKQTIPHFYLTVDCEIDALLALRSDINAAAPKDKDGKPAWKVSVNDLVIKALALALQRVPDANVTWTEGGMLQHKHVRCRRRRRHPRRADHAGRAQRRRRSASPTISNEMKDLAARARVRKLAPQEYQGGTTRGLQPRHVRRQGLRRRDQPAARDHPRGRRRARSGRSCAQGKVEVATIMTVTLSTDHRAVDGALGARAARRVQDADREAGGDAGCRTTRRDRWLRYGASSVSTAPASLRIEPDPDVLESRLAAIAS